MNPIDTIKRWIAAREELLQKLDKLQLDTDQLRKKLAALQHDKDQAERQAEERRREKDSLRARLSAQKKASESTVLVSEQLSAKIAELREENEKLLRKKKSH
ncbi:MAG: hypothetical protein H7Y17_01085 [Chlorobia bacterium]|nr:hypothetical protein [Fimbriimonadaceae bacterium]